MGAVGTRAVEEMGAVGMRAVEDKTVGDACQFLRDRVKVRSETSAKK